MHPPLAKLIFALVGWLFDYDGNFFFDEIGHSFEGQNVPYAEMRAVSAICGSLIVILFYLILIELDFSLNVALIATSLVLLGKNDKIFKIQQYFFFFMFNSK